ncbi:MAG: RNA polymerase sigma factor WhiG, partial [Planctomycetota bacterium]
MARAKKRSKEEVARLWKEYKKTGALEFKNTLAEHYLPIVRYQAEKMIERLPHNVQIEDLCSAGIFGLFEAIAR